LVVITGDCGNGNTQSVSDPVNRRGTGAALFSLDVGERCLAHTDFPGEFRLMPAVFFTKTPDCCAVLTKPYRCPARELPRGGDRLCPAHARQLMVLSVRPQPERRHWWTLAARAPRGAVCKVMATRSATAWFAGFWAWAAKQWQGVAEPSMS